MLMLTASATNLLAQSPKPWVAIYWPCWELGSGVGSSPLPVDSVDFSAVNEWILFGNAWDTTGAFVEFNGTNAGNVLNPAGVELVIDSAHASSSKVLMCLGGANTGTQWVGATDAAHLHAFIHNIINKVDSLGYDGVDIDWEGTFNQAQFDSFVVDMKDSLGTGRILSYVPGYTQAVLAKAVYSSLDQIDFQDYNLMGNYSGWVSWYASSIYPYTAGDTTVTDGDGRAGGKAVPSCSGLGSPASDGGVYQTELAGIPAAKLGIGSEFGGDVWRGGVVADSAGVPVTSGNGITMAGESWSTTPSWAGDQSYSYIMGTFGGNTIHWDPYALASYISIDDVGNANDYFITFDDSASFAAKLKFVVNDSLGGMIIWDFGLAGSYAKGLLAGLKADYAAIVDTVAPRITITSPAAAGDTITGKFDTLRVSASDSLGSVYDVTYFINDTTIGVARSSPFSLVYNSLNHVNGTSELKATAQNTAGYSGSDSIPVVIYNPPDTTAPAVSISVPASGDSVQASFQIVISSSDNNYVDSLFLYVNGVPKDTITNPAPSVSIQYDAIGDTLTTDTLTAKARDPAGNTATSAAVAVYVRAYAPQNHRKLFWLCY